MAYYSKIQNLHGLRFSILFNFSKNIKECTVYSGKKLLIERSGQIPVKLHNERINEAQVWLSVPFVGKMKTHCLE
jgi:hypothetical protein